MMNTEKNIKMANAFAKLTALQDALAQFGIDSDVMEWTNEGNGARAVSLRADLWNCVDGSDVLFEIYTDEDSDFQEWEHYAEPEGQADALFAKAFEEIAEEK
jgi:hypothetical protein